MTTTPYSPRLTQVILLSHAAASRLGQPHVGPEQLLLGLLGVEGGSAHRMMAAVGVMPYELERQFVEGSHAGYPTPAGQHPLSTEAENALYIVGREADFWN